MTERATATVVTPHTPGVRPAMHESRAHALDRGPLSGRVAIARPTHEYPGDPTHAARYTLTNACSLPKEGLIYEPVVVKR